MDFLTRLQRQVLVFDGAMGSLIQAQELSAEDFGGPDLEGCNENLVLTKPDAISKIHDAYFAAGADIVETNTFGSATLALAEYDLGHKAREISRVATQLAKECAIKHSTPDKPRYVAGSIGPGTKLPTLGHVTYAELLDSFREQIIGLIEGGADVLTIETCQDILQIKAALNAAEDAMIETGRRVPRMVSVTIEQTGTMLIGTEITAALTALIPYNIDIIGMNCATGPKEMEDHVRTLSQQAPMMIAINPNAGLPENVGGKAVYSLTPEEFTKWQLYFLERYGVNIVGGCCGTTPEHIGALAAAVGNKAPTTRTHHWVPSVSSIYSSVAIAQEPAPMLIGERTNANGSRKFKELLQAEDWEGIVDMGKDQVGEGAHTIDVCVAYVGRDEVKDMEESVKRIATQVPLPIVIDSTEIPVLERALQIAGGRCIINSINLEDGEERADKICQLAKRYGAALIALTIDEDGMAKTAEHKVAVAKRIHDICVHRHGLRPEDLIFDALTFTLGSGDQEFYDAGIQTLEGIKGIKSALPGVYTTLGVSNISFGLGKDARVVLNSIFLHAAVEAGLDTAIVHVSKILPINRIPEEAQKLAHNLVFNHEKIADPLTAYMGYFDTNTVATDSAAVDDSADSIEDRLQSRIVNGNKKQLTELLDQAMETLPPLEIINTILLGGMKTVGELFGSGQMQLPFVLQSAEVMKAAVAHLEPHMEQSETNTKGTMVLATVKGDVHDIGKNLVDIILTNNGYTVHNLGIKIGLEEILTAAQEHKADAIGMSGLLVKSTAIMKENLEEMAHREIDTPVICGGAALTRRFVEHDLSESYGNTVYYGKDAFEGLRVMEALAEGDVTSIAPKSKPKPKATAPKTPAVKIIVPKRSPVIDSDNAIPTPPFWGSKVVQDIPLEQLWPLINTNGLFKGQWQFRQGNMSKADYQVLLDEKILPIFEDLKAKVIKENLFETKVVYGYFPCQSDGDTLIVHDPETKKERERFTFPRQQEGKFYCLADFFRPVESGEMDVVAFHAVTVGSKVKTVCDELYANDNYTDYLYLHGLSVETAEALAEHWHKTIRAELGIADQDAPEASGLWRQGYQGSRYSFGYPACPNMEDQDQLFRLIEPGRIGIELSETYQMNPEASTSAIVMHHPQARYFDVK